MQEIQITLERIMKELKQNIRFGKILQQQLDLSLKKQVMRKVMRLAMRLAIKNRLQKLMKNDNYSQLKKKYLRKILLKIKKGKYQFSIKNKGLLQNLKLIYGIQEGQIQEKEQNYFQQIKIIEQEN